MGGLEAKRGRGRPRKVGPIYPEPILDRDVTGVAYDDELEAIVRSYGGEPSVPGILDMLESGMSRGAISHAIGTSISEVKRMEIEERRAAWAFETL